MKETKALQVKKENVITKLFDFFKKMINKDHKDALIEINLSEYIENDFDKSIKVNKVEKSQVVKNQEKYEKGSLKLESLSNKEIHDLSILYQRQVIELQKILGKKLEKLNDLKKMRMENN